MSEPWLTLIGIGDNGLDSLSGESLAFLMGSKVIVVSERLEQVIDQIHKVKGASSPPSVLSGPVVTEIDSLDRFRSHPRTRSSTRLKGGDQPNNMLPENGSESVRTETPRFLPISPLEGEMSPKVTEGGEGLVKVLKWSDGYRETLAMVLELRGTPVTILGTGDPMHFGIGSTLLKHIEPEEMRIIPSPSAFSLAAARLGWPLQNVAQISLHGRAVETLNRHVYPGTRILALTSDGSTISSVATILVERGFGSSLLSVLEHLGGPKERVVQMTADRILQYTPEFADFNTLGIDCVASSTAKAWSAVTGLPDDAFQHDGQLTKREVRAATLSLLQPMPGQHLWDVGAGCGSISIEWMRAAPGCTASAIETKPERLAMIAANARSLGVPDLKIVTGEAPAALHGLVIADAIFIGGGITGDGVFEACWSALKPGGRLVANAVTLDGEAKLIGLRSIHGGDMTRISVSHASPVGRYCGWKSLMPVTIWSVVKPLVKEEGRP